MSVFDAMLDDLFADQNMAFDADYTPAGGSARTVRAMLSAPDAPIGGFETRARGTALKIDLRRADTPKLDEGDTIEIGAGDTVPADIVGVYTVASAAADPDRLCWMATLKVKP